RLMRALFGIAALMVAGSLAACRAPDVLEATPARRSTLDVEYRVLAPPPGCGTARAPVVFLPALGFTGHSFAAVAAHMDACRARVLVDLPGVGSEAGEPPVSSARVVDAIAEAIAAESREPVILVGHSIGGAARKSVV